MMTRKICVVTGTRADYGLLKWLIGEISGDPELTLQLIATGMHLSPEFGLTVREIEQDGFRIDRKVEMLLSSDSAAGTAKSLGLGVIGFADALADLAPDVMVVLGDRFEIFAAVSAALFAKIPVAHLHGGEITEGAYDDAMRHSMTKMSHLHFVSTAEYRDRVIQLGAKNLLITFHPVTLDEVPGTRQMQALLQVLGGLEDTSLIFTLPNADTGGREMIRMLEDFVKKHDNARAYASLGQLRYLSCLAHVDGVIGNSSSGLLEAPSLKTGTVNIGDRQKGRPCATSVINCEPSVEAIAGAIARLYSEEFKNKLAFTQNPYGDGGASEKIADVLKRTELAGLSTKRFYNLPHCRPETKSD